MKFVHWWLQDLFIPWLCILTSLWLTVMIIKVFNYLYNLI